MNQIVEKNRKAIVTAGENICKILSLLITMTVKNKQTYLDLTKDGVYNGTYLEERLKEINANFRAQAATYAPKLNNELDSIEAAGHALESSLDVTDQELSSTLQIITATNGKIDLDTEKLILDTFKGNQAALRVIKSTYEHFGLRTDELKRFIFSIDENLFFMRARVDPLISEPDANRNEMFNLRNDLKVLCKLIGAEVAANQFSLGENEDDAATASLRQSMGLPE
jgi:hypothetical protein